MFEFNLGGMVEDRATGVMGMIIGRSEYLYNGNFYLVRWKDKNGVANQEWFPEKQIVKV